MPISRKNRARYPVNWKAISMRIRFERAAGRCECRGECGTSHWGDDAQQWRCPRVHGSKTAKGGGKVVLTVAHLNHVPEDVSEGNLRAMCQQCHLAYDHAHHQASAAETRRRKTGA